MPIVSKLHLATHSTAVDLDHFRRFCLSLPASEETLPFGPDALVMKVMGKMYALARLEPFGSFNVKCDPEIAQELREQYPAVLPGYHMNKKHWNTVELNGSIPMRLLEQWIADSYHLVVASLPKAQREALGEH